MKPKLKYIKGKKQVNSWCVTYHEAKKQRQKWFSNKEEAEEFIKELKEE